MSPAFPTRRRAEQLDALLDGTATKAPTGELATLLAVVERVRAVPEVAPRAEFAASLRERLMAEAPAALATPARDAETTARLTVRRTPSAKSRERRIGVAVAAFSIVGGTAASAVASQGALPGDTLYPVKRLIEDTQTSLAMGEGAKADSLLSRARTRLDETRELAERDDPDTREVEQALRDFGDATDAAATAVLADYADHGGAAKVDELRTVTQDGVTTLSRLTGVLPPSLDDVLADVTGTLLDIDHSAAQACPTCDAAGITELPSTLVDLLAATTSAVGQTTSLVPPSQGTGAGRGPKGTVPSAPVPSATPGTQPPRSGTQAGDPAGGSTGGSTGGTGGTGGAGGTATKPGGSPTSVGGAVGGAGGAVGGAVGGVGGAVGDLGDDVGGPVGDVLGGVGDTVGGVGGTVGGVTGGVGDTLDDVLGGLLPSATPTPKHTPRATPKVNPRKTPKTGPEATPEP